jgi:hypothetical protein
MEDRGVEQGEKTTGNYAVCSTGGAESGAVDAGLDVLINAWPALSEGGRKSILAVVRQEAVTAAKTIHDTTDN